MECNSYGCSNTATVKVILELEIGSRAHSRMSHGFLCDKHAEKYRVSAYSYKIEYMSDGDNWTEGKLIHKKVLK